MQPHRGLEFDTIYNNSLDLVVQPQQFTEVKRPFVHNNTLDLVVQPQPLSYWNTFNYDNNTLDLVVQPQLKGMADAMANIITL